MIKKLLARLPEKYRKLSKRALIGIFIYYLVRDLTLYVALPWWLATKAIP